MQYQNPKPRYRLWEFCGIQTSNVLHVLFHVLFVLTLPFKKAKFILLFQSTFLLWEKKKTEKTDPSENNVLETHFTGIYFEFPEQSLCGNVKFWTVSTIILVDVEETKD